jgi:hypothetical protein
MNASTLLPFLHSFSEIFYVGTQAQGIPNQTADFT